MEEAILFAQYVSDECYTDTFRDIEGDGKTWTSFKDDQSGFNYHESTRYTIEEIYNKFKTSK